ncbi:membrane oxidoreductase, partial [Mycolicibacterium agri]
VAAVQSEPEPIDLLDLAGGGALLKYGPYAAVGLLVAALLFLLGRRSASKGA